MYSRNSDHYIDRRFAIYCNTKPILTTQPHWCLNQEPEKELVPGEHKEALVAADYMPDIILREQGVIDVARHPDCVTLVMKFSFR
ncbi:hypothetical protein LXL04_005819 [Taraxacum kok-saghyz]